MIKSDLPATRGGLERTKQLSDCQSVVYPTLHMERNVKPRVHSSPHTHTSTHPTRRYVHVKCQVKKHFKQSKSRLNRGCAGVCVCLGVCMCICGDVSVLVCVSCRSPCQAIYKSKARQGKFLTGKTAGDAPDSILGLGVSTVDASSFHSILIPGFHHHWLN